MLHDTVTDLVSTDQALRVFALQHPEYCTTAYKNILDISSRISEWLATITKTMPQEDQAVLHHLLADLEVLSIHQDVQDANKFIFHLSVKHSIEELDPNTEEGHRSLGLLLFYVRHNEAYPGIYYWCYSDGRHISLPDPYNTAEDIQTALLQKDQHFGGIVYNGILSQGITAAFTAQAKQWKQMRSVPRVVLCQIKPQGQRISDTYALFDDSWIPCLVTHGYDHISKAPITTLLVPKNV